MRTLWTPPPLPPKYQHTLWTNFYGHFFFSSLNKFQILLWTSLEPKYHLQPLSCQKKKIDLQVSFQSITYLKAGDWLYLKIKSLLTILSRVPSMLLLNTLTAAIFCDYRFSRGIMMMQLPTICGANTKLE